MSVDGRPEHDGDIAAQLALAADNLEAVLGEADMSLANLVRLNVYTTDVDDLFTHYGVLAGRLGTPASRRPLPCSGSLTRDPRPVGRTRGTAVA